jgi:hypothetical protein
MPIPKILEPGKPPKKTKGATDAKQTLEEMAYKDETGMYIPSDNIRQMLIGNKARKGAAEILGSYIEAKKGGEYRSFCDSCIWVIGPDDPEKVYYKPLRKTWDGTDLRSILSGKGKSLGRQWVERPLIKTPWSLTFFVHVMDDNFEQGKVKEFFEVGGLRCGLGVYGPKFGRYRVVEWEVQKTK